MKAAILHPGRVVVIEDDFELRRLLIAFLESCGYQVFAAASGKEGIALAKRLRPQAVTLDLCLPDMSGLDLLRVLKSGRGTKGIPVIVVSASTELMSCLDRQRAFSVVRKPFNLIEIETAVALTIHTEGPSCSSLLRAS